MEASRPSITKSRSVRSRAPRFIRQGLRRYSVAHFLIALTLLVIAMPFVDRFEYGRVVETVFFTLVILSAVTAVGGRRRTFILAAVLAIPALIGRWIDHFDGDPKPHAFTLLAVLICFGFITAHLLRFILRAPTVDSEVLCAGLAVFILIAILWALGYMMLSVQAPDSFGFTTSASSTPTMIGFHAVYFSFESLTGGCGDIVPASDAARLLVMVESTTGLLYVTVLIARLVGLYSTGRGAAS